MADRYVLARLRIIPCGISGLVNHTISLQQIGSDYCLIVYERDVLTREQSRWRVPISERLVQEQLTILKHATIPAFPVSPLICDGEYVELMVEGEHSTLTLGWWTIAPQGAECFSNFADWLRKTGLRNNEQKN